MGRLIGIKCSIKKVSLITPNIPEAEILTKIKSGGDPSALRNGIEIIVNSKSFAEAINSRFHIVDGQEYGRNLRLIAELALAGILFYAGCFFFMFLIKHNPFQFCSILINYLKLHKITM